jgi:hypothetical protein
VEFYGLGPEFPSDQLFTSSDTVPLCTHTHKNTHTLSHTHTHTHTCARAHTHTLIRMHVHVHIHTSIHDFLTTAPVCACVTHAQGNKIYFVSAAVRHMLAADGKGQLHTVHAGRNSDKSS